MPDDGKPRSILASLFGPGPNDDPDEFYARRRNVDRAYFTRPFKNDPNKRFAIRVWDAEDAPRFEWVGKYVRLGVEEPPGVLKVKDEAVIQTQAHGRHRFQIKAVLLEDSREIESVVIQRFTEETGKPHPNFLPVSLGKADVKRLVTFFRSLRFLSLPDGRGERFDGDMLDALSSDAAARVRFLREHPELADLLRQQVGADPVDAAALAKLVLQSGLAPEVVQIIADSELRVEHVVSTAHRRDALEQFRRLLNEPTDFARMKSEWGCRRDEDVWQRFFDANTWILGYGLQYQFMTALDGKKIEQVVAGYSVGGAGKRTDGLLKTLGAVNSLCFVEFKNHTTELLHGGTYRSEVYRPSAELSGAVAQIQGTVQKAVVGIGEALRPKDEEDFPTGELLHNIAPKALVICGSLAQLVGPQGEPSVARVRSFELYRRSLRNPEVITYDELYERARYIVEGDAPASPEPGDAPSWEHEPPF